MKLLTLLSTLLSFCFLQANSQDVFTVSVGDDGAFYDPQIVAASIGSIINFKFVGTAHTVSQSNYENPCAPAEGGFDSGFAGLAFENSTLENPMEWNLTITNDSIPIWYHCRASLPQPHCQVGMVGGINLGPPSTVNAMNQSFVAFLSAAKAATIPQPTATASSSLIGFGATATGPPALRVTPAVSTNVSSTTPSPTPPPVPAPTQSLPPPEQSANKSAPVSTIVGAIVGGCAGIIVICGLIYLLQRSRQKASNLEAERMSRDGSSWLSAGSSSRNLRPKPYYAYKS